MKKLSQKQILLKHLQQVHDWVPAYRLRSVQTLAGWVGHSGDRRLRELANEGKVEVRRKGKYAEYRYHTASILDELHALLPKKEITQQGKML